MLNLRVFSLGFVLAGVIMLIGFGNSAFAQGQCGITVAKAALGDGDTLFSFEVSVDGNAPFTVNLTDGESDGGPFNSSVTVTELPLERWRLEDIECEGEGGIEFDITGDSFTAVCSGSGFGTCTFFNRSISGIPTLSEWGMIAAAAGLGLIGLLYVARRKRAAA